MAATSSLYLTVIITLERYICICHPFWFEEWCSYSRICKSVAATIVLSFAYHMSKFWEYGLVERTYIQEEKPITFYLPDSKLTRDPQKSHIYALVFSFVDYLIPLTCIVVLNTITFIKLKKISRVRRQISDEQRNEDKLTAMMLYVVLEFLGRSEVILDQNVETISISTSVGGQDQRLKQDNQEAEDPRLPNSTTVVLVALAVCDTLVILTSLWLEVAINYGLLKAYAGLPRLDKYDVIYLYNYYTQWSFVSSEVIYKMAVTSSLYLTVIITLERYICICHPFWFEEWCSYSRICKSVAATIVFSIAYHMTGFWESQVIDSPIIYEGKITSYYVPVIGTLYHKLKLIRTWTFTFVDYLLPLTSIVVLNTITTIKLRRMNRNRREISDERKNENKLTVMMLYVVMEFLVSHHMASVVNKRVDYLLTGVLPFA
ncbi:hypothetical protein GE061_003013 [Apolygus lucorum]|uniref:G-protein coupled receptors family 1 profile domain-containing protein n=1 Tax=Apolygus lucorum TaxID=248454 RepID=A0A8S9X2B4_APOLU|nr:hypothetical protein GE061_003013 [Apolygus lucorum]